MDVKTDINIQNLVLNLAPYIGTTTHSMAELTYIYSFCVFLQQYR